MHNKSIKFKPWLLLSLEGTEADKTWRQGLISLCKLVRVV